MATEHSSEPKPGSPSFFKVVRDPSAPHLSLPIAFVRSYLAKIPKYATFTTATREHSWRLKLKKIGEDYCFADGWEKLANDVQLRTRDFIVFWLTDVFTFQVSFFDEHGCEKDLPLNATGNGGEHDDVDGDGDDSVTQDENLYFQRVISGQTYKYTMLLPKKFVDDAGLENKTSVIMKNNEGKEWNIGLKVEKYRNTRYYLAAGWSLFQKYHELSEGDMCLFRYIKKENVMILAQLIKSKRPTKPETDVAEVKKKVGRLPIEKPGGGGGVKVKVEYESGPEVEVLKRKRGGPPLEKHSGGGGVEVKIEDESWPEVEVVKRKKERPVLDEPGGGGGNDGGVGNGGGGGGLGNGGVGLGNGGGGEVKTEPDAERWVTRRQVIYF